MEDPQLSQLINRVESYCRLHGFVLTAQRKAVITNLFTQQYSIEGEALWLGLIVNGFAISQPSVFAALRWLVRNDFVEQSVNGRRQIYRLKR